MANLRSDSPTSRRIVSAFLDFLHSVEPAPGVDLEGLEVAKDCLIEVFKLNQLPESERSEPSLLVKIFSSHEQNTKSEVETSHNEESRGVSSTHTYADAGPSVASQVQNDAGVRESSDAGLSKDELFGQFFDALEKIRYFRTTPSGNDDHVLLDRATCLFHDAVDEMERSGCNTFVRKSLADALKTLGNKAMQSNEYSDAIERYTCSIALCENAVYYCNRAAAYTQIHKYDEAIKDCLNSIEIDPYYSKAYSRLGLAYYAQGNYSDAINKGFKKALELDPNNDAVKENIRVAEQKLKEHQEQRHRHQDSRNHHPGGTGNQSTLPPFASVSFDTGMFPANFANIFSNIAGNASQDPNAQSQPEENSASTHSSSTSTSFDSTGIPPDMAHMFMNFAGNAFPGQDSQTRSMSFDASALPNGLAGMFMNMAGQGSQGPSSRAQQGGSNNVNVGDSGSMSGSDDAGIDMGANITFNLGNQLPEELASTLRSVMGMFSGGVQGDVQGNNDDARSTPR